jgi:hypothetical protein
MSDCELCKPSDVLLESALAYVRLDSNALSRGHVLASGGIRCVLARRK